MIQHSGISIGCMITPTCLITLKLAVWNEWPIQSKICPCKLHPAKCMKWSLNGLVVVIPKEIWVCLNDCYNITYEEWNSQTSVSYQKNKVFRDLRMSFELDLVHVYWEHPDGVLNFNNPSAVPNLKLMFCSPLITLKLNASEHCILCVQSGNLFDQATDL